VTQRAQRLSVVGIEPQAVAHRIEEAAAILEGGGLLIVPTETVYGLAADARLEGAQDRIYDAKQRERGKPIPLLAADADAVACAGVEFNEIEERLARRFWPGPLTLVLQCGETTEGFRVPDHDICRALLRRMGGLLRVTSANLSGEPAALTADEAVAAIGHAVEGVLDAGPSAGGTASTVLRVDDGKIVILREGAISRERLRKEGSGVTGRC